MINGEKSRCFGCEACVQACCHNAIQMQEDSEGFRYPVIDTDMCVNCGLCRKVCPCENAPELHDRSGYVFGGYILDADKRFESTSGGAFSAIAQAYCDENYVIFGAEADGLSVFHSSITDISELGRFRKSKYSQSVIGDSYAKAKQFLMDGRKVLFSGTPCQIAGLRAYLGSVNQDLLLTVEVVCEGVPSPLYMRKFDEHVKKKYGYNIKSLDYRYTGKSRFFTEKRKSKSDMAGKWDFQMMHIVLDNGREIKSDRWFIPFWQIWINHLMSRPSCYSCPFALQQRGADITLGDLWGVHLYCPELYGNNGGASLVVCNTEKGIEVCKKAQDVMYGHELNFADALKYQGPMRKCISMNPQREEFMQDLQSDSFDYRALNKKWYKPPTLKLLWQKYVWGNRQKIRRWNKKHNNRNIE